MGNTFLILILLSSLNFSWWKALFFFCKVEEKQKEGGGKVPTGEYSDGNLSSLKLPALDYHQKTLYASLNVDTSRFEYCLSRPEALKCGPPPTSSASLGNFLEIQSLSYTLETDIGIYSINSGKLYCNQISTRFPLLPK